MKTIITLSALALINSVALADVFEYEKQVGSQDLDPHAQQLDHIQNPEPSSQSIRVSLHNWYQGNPDVVHVPYDYSGELKQSESRLFTSYDAASAGNPDLIS